MSTIRGFAVSVATAMLVALSVVAQRPTNEHVPQWQIDAGGKQVFEVASVKQNIAHTPAHSTLALTGLDEAPPNGGLLSAGGFQLSVYMMFAYKLTPSQYRLLESQLPKWATSDVFDIEARADAKSSTDQIRLMMQSLLADRFKLAVHAETRDLPVLELVLDKPGKIGPRLIRLSEDVPCAVIPASVPGASPPAAKYDGWFTPCGGVGAKFVSGRVHVGSENLSIGELANVLPVVSRNSIDRPVFDKTGLSGKFDFTMEYTPEPNGPPRPDFEPDPTGPTFLEALKDQLGLKLVPQIGPVDVLVVDHVEEPTPN
jgi:bla regulator protein blaR1